MKALVFCLFIILFVGNIYADEPTTYYTIESDFSTSDSLYLVENGNYITELMLYAEDDIPNFKLIPFEHLVNVKSFGINYTISNSEWLHIFNNMKNINDIMVYVFDSVPEIIYKQMNIKELYIDAYSNTNLLIKNNICNLSSLENLIIECEDNTIEILPPINEMKSLKRLEIKSKRKILGLETFLKYLNPSQLQTLKINCKNESINFDYLNKFRDLETVWLNMPNYKNSNNTVKLLCETKSIKELRFSINNICFDSNKIEMANNIEHFSVKSNSIGDVGVLNLLSYFSDSNNLKVLLIESKNIYSIPESISKFQYLNKLTIRSKRIKNISYEITKLKKLESIKICKSKRKFKKSEHIQKIKKKMTWCHFDFYCSKITIHR